MVNATRSEDSEDFENPIFLFHPHVVISTFKPFINMKPSLKTCMLLFFMYLSGALLQAQEGPVAADFKMPQHPRILLFAGEEQGIRNALSGDPEWQVIHEAILRESDKIIGLEPIKRIQIGRRLLDKSREALRRVFMLSYASRTTGEKKYFARAEKEMLDIAAFSDWNPSHFLDVAEMTMAMAIGYDWLHDKLSAASKTAIRDAIMKKGLEPSMEPRYSSWLKAEHNWNQVCNAGMTYGAMALYEDHPVFARNIINRAIGSIVLPMKDYGPDGVYPEGYGYWGYGTSFNVMFLSAIEKLFGKDFGLTGAPGFLQSGRFMEFMTGPSGSPFNYSDAGNSGGFHPAMFWIADKVGDPSILWEERRFLKNYGVDRLVGDRLLPAIMLWRNGLKMDKITEPKINMWVGMGKNPVAMMRTSWTDPNAIYLALKGGSVSVNHAHMDIGSFIMEADGVRWAMDFGMQNYESLESKGIQLFGRAQNAQRWSVFRLTNLVHNTLAVNNQHQIVTGTAPIIAHGSAPAFMHAVTDLSEIYNGQVAKSVRGIALVNKRFVVVRDEVKTFDRETTIRWTMLTPADVKISGTDRAILTKDGKTMLLQVDAPGKMQMRTWSTDPPNSYDAPNPGTTLVGFEVKVPANTETAFTVKLIPGGKAGKAKMKIQPLDSWKNL